MILKTLIVLFSLATLLLLGSGCSGCGSVSSGTSGTGLEITDRQSVKPGKLAFGECVLVLAGDRWPAKITEKWDGDDYQIDLVAHGEVIESERYKTTDEAFSLMAAVGESFSPPIPLIKYGMHLGDTWSWTGVTVTGPTQHKAAAKVVTSSETLTIKGQTVPNVIRVDVQLAFDSGIPSAPAPRKISFWIAPQMGVVKRSYENYSVREPPEK